MTLSEMLTKLKDERYSAKLSRNKASIVVSFGDHGFVRVQADGTLESYMYGVGRSRERDRMKDIRTALGDEASLVGGPK